MADKKQNVQAVAKPSVQSKLTQEQKEDIVEEVLGVHPRYFLKSGLNLKIDIFTLNAEGKHFNGWTFKERHQ